MSKTFPYLIGFCGAAESGKSTAAKILIQHYGFTRIRFAAPLKAMLKAVGLSDREVDGDLKEVPSRLLGGKTPRQAMQWLGTEWGRNMISPSIWIDLWSEEVSKLQPLGTPITDYVKSVVVDDVRFADEADAIRSRGGMIIKIERPSAGSATGSDHESEALRFKPDCIIPNYGSLSDLEEQFSWLSARI